MFDEIPKNVHNTDFFAIETLKIQIEFDKN